MKIRSRGAGLGQAAPNGSGFGRGAASSGILDDGLVGVPQCRLLRSQKPEGFVLDDLQEQTLLAQMIC